MESDRARLMAELKRIEKPEDFGGDVDDNSEEQGESEELANALAQGQALRDRINEIDSALNKMREGNYGICEKCGMEISEKELDLIPETRLCEHCKK